MMIEDGTGKGYKLKVDDENMIRSLCIIIPLMHHVNHEHGEVYSIIISETPTGAGDCFFYLKNTSDKDLIINKLRLSAASDESIQLKLGDSGTVAGGSDNTPINRNAGSGNTADCTCQDGVDITGLSGGFVVDDIDIDGATSTKEYLYDSDFILPKNSVFTLYAVTGAIAIKCTITVGFHVGEA